MDNKIDNKKVGKTISNLRKNSGLTQMQLAEKLYVSDKAISRWETGEGLPEILNLVELSKIFNVPMEYILKGEGAEIAAVETMTPTTQETYSNTYEAPKQPTKTTTPSTNVIISVVLGGVGLFTAFFIASLVGMIFAIVGLVLAKRKPGEEKTSLHTIAKILNIATLVVSIALTIITILLILTFGSFTTSIFSEIFDMMNQSMQNFPTGLMGV